ncbi:MAG: hypothetical protein ACLFUE_05035 [Desulfobacteraceae bacterium]
MSQIPAALFPHSGLSTRELSAVLSLLSPLTVFVPWHMEPGEALAEEIPKEAVRAARPPEEFQPPEGFDRTLSDYKQWILRNADRSLLSSLKAGAASGDEDDPLWEIRSSIRKGGLDLRAVQSEVTTRWHLVLHLARELEEQRGEADRILGDLRMQKSPLDGATEEPEEARGLFDDLPGFSWGPEAVPAHPAPVVEAWVGLFGTLLEPEAFLVTLEKVYVDYLAELWSEVRDNPSGPPALRFQIPDLSAEDPEEVVRLRREHLSDSAATRLKEILSGFGEQPEEDLLALSKEAEALAAWRRPSAGEGRIVFTAVRFVKGLSDMRIGRSPFPVGFWDRTLLYLEKPL